jgi:hypothetical protein
MPSFNLLTATSTHSSYLNNQIGRIFAAKLPLDETTINTPLTFNSFTGESRIVDKAATVPLIPGQLATSIAGKVYYTDNKPGYLYPATVETEYFFTDTNQYDLRYSDKPTNVSIPTGTVFLSLNLSKRVIIQAPANPGNTSWTISTPFILGTMTVINQNPRPGVIDNGTYSVNIPANSSATYFFYSTGAV